MLCRSGGERFGVLSTVHLDLSRKEWEHRAKRLQLLQIPSNTDLGPSMRKKPLYNYGYYYSSRQLLCHQNCYSFYYYCLSPPAASGRYSTYLVFLPPRYHLLLKLNCVDSGVSVLLATDCWRALGLVNDHLHSLSTGTRDS